MQPDRLYRAVVSLNNMGVSLLEQGRYRHARATLAEAMVLLKPAFRSLAEAHQEADARSSSDIGGHDGAADVDQVMAEANRRYARPPSIRDAKNTGANLTPRKSELVQIAVLSSRADASDIETATSKEVRGSSSPYPVLHPIRLELNDHEVLCNAGASEKEEAFVTCLAVLQNCSIATLLATDLETAPESATAKPFRMLDVCHRVLSGLGQYASSHHQLRQQTYLEYVVQKTAVEMFLITGRREEAQVLAPHLDHLQDGLDDLSRFERFAQIGGTALNAVAPAA
jgi:hypothetical protein